MKKLIFALIALCFIQTIKAQFIKEKALNAMIGFGISVPNQSATDIAGNGFFAQGELILKSTSWFEFRPYTGFIYTSSDDEDLNNVPTDERVETTAFFLGGKFRLRAPIPYVAPYLELGIGASIGSFRTFTVFDDIDKSGLAYHIPIAFGLEFGRDHNVDVGLLYYFHPNEEQFSGGFGVGVTILL